MSNEQEIPASQVDAEVGTEAETEQDAVVSEETAETVADTEIGEHEYSIDELKKELGEAKQKAQENWDKALRIQAEMENLKRRTQKDLEDAHKFALTGFAKELLPVLDSLELGLQAATGDNDEVKKFREGSELTIKQFEAAFAKFNVVTINPVGEPFNAEHHQAMVMQVVEGAAPNTVVTVFQKGYLLNGRLLRPAMVVVAKAAD
ncbi:MAG: nucleotide exchange factor GrpE [Methylobacter sp.]|uniref:nucleotide exchange factor GrpE n=1 Tax=Methylovulum miyakonense TaxID=645578 RepID=UPI00035F4657|nr:nucleotide exchange factor GrpE [Methylovulum miyakonense]PPD40327.1 MAG: nucleotide exchange factor GrpE [Methylobacter sp.]